MSRTIKVEDDLYHQLDQYRAKGETFSDALRRVLQAAALVIVAPKAPGGQFTIADHEVLERYRRIPGAGVSP